MSIFSRTDYFVTFLNLKIFLPRFIETLTLRWRFIGTCASLLCVHAVYVAQKNEIMRQNRINNSNNKVNNAIIVNGVHLITTCVRAYCVRQTRSHTHTPAATCKRIDR